MKVLIGVDPHNASTPARTTGWTPWPPRWPPGATSGYPRSIPTPGRKRCACFPRGAGTWSAERARALNRLHDFLRDLLPGGVPGTLSPPRAARILRRIRPQGASAASAGGWLRRPCATPGRWGKRSRTSTGASKPRWKPLVPASRRSSAWAPYWPPRSQGRSAARRVSRPGTALAARYADLPERRPPEPRGDGGGVPGRRRHARGPRELWRGRARVTNLPWNVDEAGLEEELGPGPGSPRRFVVRATALRIDAALHGALDSPGRKRAGKMVSAMASAW